MPRCFPMKNTMSFRFVPPWKWVWKSWWRSSFNQTILQKSWIQFRISHRDRIKLNLPGNTGLLILTILLILLKLRFISLNNRSWTNHRSYRENMRMLIIMLLRLALMIISIYVSSPTSPWEITLVSPSFFFWKLLSFFFVPLEEPHFFCQTILYDTFQSDSHNNHFSENIWSASNHPLII